MAILFRELKQYISRVDRLSICFYDRDGDYENYSLLSDIPEGKYDSLAIYGVGTAFVEFPLDVYSNPCEEMPKCVSRWSGYDMKSCLEIVLTELPRDIERKNIEDLCFGDLRNYLQIGGGYCVVMKEDWSSEEYEWQKDIPKEYDSFFVYGIGLEDLPKDKMESRHFGSIKKQIVIVLSKTPREDIIK